MINVVILIVLVITQVLGDIWLSQGMKIYGEITSYSPQSISNLFGYLFTSIWIWIGVGSLAFSWFIYLISVSRMDLSFVLPIHASSYLLNAVFAWLMLHEIVTQLRWLATITIALGVFIVGWSEYKTKNKLKKQVKNRNLDQQNINLFMFSLPLTLTLPKFWLRVLILVFADSFGDLLTAKGMKKVGSISDLSFKGIIKWITKIATNLSLLLGIASQAIGLLMFISLLSWDDISLIRPATALGYIVTLLAAKYILQETINKGRLIGITVIGLGILIISLS